MRTETSTVHLQVAIRELSQKSKKRPELTTLIATPTTPVAAAVEDTPFDQDKRLFEVARNVSDIVKAVEGEGPVPDDRGWAGSSSESGGLSDIMGGEDVSDAVARNDECSDAGDCGCRGGYR